MVSPVCISYSVFLTFWPGLSAALLVKQHIDFKISLLAFMVFMRLHHCIVAPTQAKI